MKSKKRDRSTKKVAIPVRRLAKIETTGRIWGTGPTPGG
jgi:hypothetical protein